MSANAADIAAFKARPIAGASDDTLAVQNNLKFQELVRGRNGLAWALSGAMLFIYLGFILLVALNKSLLASKVGGGTTSLGIVLGLVVIVSAIVLSGIYVARANGRFDDLTADLRRELGQ